MVKPPNISHQTLLELPADNSISPYDPQYPMYFFTNSIKNKLSLAQSTVEDIYHAVIKETPAAYQLQSSLRKGSRFVVDISDSTLKAIDEGKLKLTQEKGQLYAQLKNGNKYGDKLPIKREDFRNGINPQEMALALQMKALQEQIQEIADQIAVIDKNVHDVLEGLQNDRIGLYFSGIALFLESQEINDSELKQHLEVQALKALSEASFQLTLSLQSDIRYLETGQYKLYKGKSKDQIDLKMKGINQSFEFIHQAMMLKAGIYCELGEINAMSTVLSEYSHFIKSTIAKNAMLLAQCDYNDDGTYKGLWKSRSVLKLDVDSLIQRLNIKNKEFYLGISEDNSNEEN